MRHTHNLSHIPNHSMKMTRTKTFDIPATKAIVFVQLALLACCIAVYIVGIVTSVTHVVLRQELAVEVRKTESRVAEMEATYLKEIEAFTKERAYAMGLTDVHTVSYVPVTTSDTLTRRD